MFSFIVGYFIGRNLHTEPRKMKKFRIVYEKNEKRYEEDYDAISYSALLNYCKRNNMHILISQEL